MKFKKIYVFYFFFYARFFEYSDFPGVIGAIDGTHVALLRPKKNEHIYFNRKHFHSLNVLLVSVLDYLAHYKPNIYSHI